MGEASDSGAARLHPGYSLDQLRPLARRLRRLSERAGDTEFALGSDVMATSLQGYALLKVAGNNQGLESVRDALRTRFSRGPRSTETKAKAKAA